MCASTLSSLVMAVPMISRLHAYTTSSKGFSCPVSLLYTRRIRRAWPASMKMPFRSLR